ncbi:pyruvate formate-lyase [Klebsiella pneumoniae subsp. rhinoscleromatis]|nr:pyruvate formate-lyase [Klebsiella pneumoniae subsp. rhinoscleromatis]
MLTVVGRIIGDYRRVALYGIDFLMKDKFAQFNSLQAKTGKQRRPGKRPSVCVKKSLNNTAHWARSKEMAAKYGYDISGPATTAQEAIQWTYFGYLAAGEISERRGNVLRSYLQLPGYLHRA